MRFLQHFVSIIRAAYCLTWLFAPIGVGTLILSLFARVAQTQEFVSHVNFRQQLQTPIDVTWVNAPT